MAGPLRVTAIPKTTGATIMIQSLFIIVVGHIEGNEPKGKCAINKDLAFVFQVQDLWQIMITNNK